MNNARTVMISLYAAGYLVAIFVGTSAIDAGEDLYAVALFGTSVGLLLGIHRECRNAARLVRVVAAYRHGAEFPGPVADLAAIERATAIPPGCRCETWWTSLGGHHSLTCPAFPARKDTR
ncbi:hypothetical protein ACIQZO_34970 [Streptomyces sp. NPDC097617]|uniref:hypothetical protein n=1 Tax=Streptomyces sp. NPDC097617 TaxID=3366091 RepID=UPI00380BE65D